MRRTPAIRFVKALSKPRPPLPRGDSADRLAEKVDSGRYPGLADAVRRTEARRREERRTRLHYFGLAGGRRSR